MIKLNPRWVFLLSFIFISVIKAHEVRHLQIFRQSVPTLKLESFETARKRVNKSDLPKLALWESMLTGRTRSLPKDWKVTFTELGLAHLFTPSGFHLSAVLVPASKLIPGTRTKRISLILLLGFIIFLCRQPALRRMALVKISQQHWGRTGGFIFALTLDSIFGSFSLAPLSFTFSFLFLGIIYSPTEKIEKLILLFMAQALISYFLTGLISPLLIVLNPLLNFGFGLAMSLLFLLAFPLWDWQLVLGIEVISWLMTLVQIASTIIHAFPFLELSLFLGLLYFVPRRWFAAVVLICSTGLNDPKSKLPGPTKYIMVKENCKTELVYGMWFKTCSPRRRSTENNT